MVMVAVMVVPRAGAVQGHRAQQARLCTHTQTRGVKGTRATGRIRSGNEM